MKALSKLYKQCNLKLVYCVLLINYCVLPITTKAQTNQTIIYTTKEGLPSNSIYRTVIDKRGFLWIATETGLARFDGKKFRNYSTIDGLTDNEVTDLFLDSLGTIWAIPFRRTPCYYNETTDKFENDQTNKELASIELSSPHKPHVLQFGGVMFSNNRRQLFLYRDNKTTFINCPANVKNFLPHKIVEYQKNKFLFFCADSIRKSDDDKYAIPVNKFLIQAEIFENKVYLAFSQGILIYQFDNKGNVSLQQEKKFPFEIRIFCKTGKRFAITSMNGTTYLLDQNTLEPTEIVSVIDGVPVRNVLEDSDENIWLSTLDKGLYKVQKKRISSIDIIALKQNLNAIFKDKLIVAGNNSGELFSYDGLYAKQLLPSSNKTIDGWVRKIINTNYGYYVASQTASFLIDKNSFKIKKSFLGKEMKNRSSKAVALLNDSVLVLGGHAFAFLYNLKTDKIFDSISKRVVSLGVDKEKNIYIGSNEGLYQWTNKQLINLGSLQKGLAYKINAIEASPDNLLWVGLGADSLIVLNKNKWVASIPLGRNIPGNVCRVLYSNKIGEVWLGTNKGINRINYTFYNNNFTYYTTYFGVSDGLFGEQVNDINIQDTTIYIATNQGLNTMPTNLQLPVSNIATFITSIKINNVSVPISKSYSLKHNENDITIEFSGVDLTGFIPLFEYNQNNSKWQQTEKIELKSLAPGNYQFKIRAIRRDGKPSTQEAVVNIKIETPFWKNSIFWLILSFGIFGSLLYIQQRINKQKQKQALEKITTEKRLAELEMQALKAQINPHFVFNCLNSIKGFIYDKDYMQADKYLDKFSELMRSTIDNSDASIISLKDEILYLNNYLQLEKLRFEDKFDYSFTIDTTINTETVFVPAMLLQPYVENAIRHGMRFLENEKGNISIMATLQNSSLVCTIDDNGIGREKAAALKSKAHIEYQSKGMSISKRRADLYKIEQQIIDKKDIDNNSLGTTIIVKIPLTLQP